LTAKEAIVLSLFIIGTPIGIVLAMNNKMIRNLLMFLVVFCTVKTDLMDINIIGRDWYRGTTRGIEVSYVDGMVWILLGVALLQTRRERKPFLPAAFAPMVIYFFYCIINVLSHDPKLFGLYELSKILRGIIAYTAVAVNVRDRNDIILLVNAFATITLYEGWQAVSQRYQMGMNRVKGSTDNPNTLSMYCCICVSMCIAMACSNVPRKTQLMCLVAIPVGIVAVVLTQSRTGFVTVFLVSLGTAWSAGLFKPKPKNIIIMSLAVLAGTFIIGQSWKTIGGRMEENKEEITNDPTQGRGYYFNLAALMRADEPLGVGLNNWSWAATNKYGGMLGMEYNAYTDVNTMPDRTVPRNSPDLAQAAPGHSLPALTQGELGYPGAVLFAIIWLRWFSITIPSLFKKKGNDLFRMFGVGAFWGLTAALIQSQTEWEFRQTPLFLLIHFMMGAVAGIIHRDQVIVKIQHAFKIQQMIAARKEKRMLQLQKENGQV